MASSFRSLGGVTFSLEASCGDEEDHLVHISDACFLCRKPLRVSAEVYMYKGDTPFCSEECRQEQIEVDEAREKEMRHRRRRAHRYTAASPPRQQAPAAAKAAEAVVAR